MRKRIHVAAAVVVREDGKILCARRGNAKNPEVARRWEFPGGKVEPGETPESALARELLEEMDFPVRVKKKIAGVEHDYAAFTILMDAFLCVPAKADASFVLREHEEARWLAPEELGELDWAPADVPVAEALRRSAAAAARPRS